MRPGQITGQLAFLMLNQQHQSAINYKKMSKKFTSYKLIGMKVQLLFRKQPVVYKCSQLFCVLPFVFQ